MNTKFMGSRWIHAALALSLFSATSAYAGKAPAVDSFYENSSGSPIISLVKNAKTSLDIEIYTMNDPQVDQELRNAVDRGVKVRIVQEGSPVGAACRVFGGSDNQSSQTADCKRMQALVKYVNNNGGTYVPFDKSLCGQQGTNCFQHGKMVIVDSKAALISTGNFDATNLCDHAAKPSTCDRDYTIVTRDTDVISSLKTVFKNDLNGDETNFETLQSARLTVSPESMKPMVDFIKSARKSLQIETQYLKDPTMNQAIIDAADRGVDVKVMVASACSFGMPKGSEAKKWKDTYSAFDKAGISTRIFAGDMKVGGVKGYLHAKAIIVDGDQAWVGSTNGSTTSLTDNREFGIFLDNADLITTLDDHLSSDFDHPESESWQESLACKGDRVQNNQNGQN